MLTRRFAFLCLGLFLFGCIDLGLSDVTPSPSDGEVVSPEAEVQDDVVGFPAGVFSNGDFSIMPPKGWVQDPSPEEGIVVLFVPSASLEKGFSSLVFRISSEPVDASITPSAYASSAVEVLSREVPGFQVIEQQNLLLKGKPISRLVFTGFQDGLERGWLQYFSASNGKMFLFTFSSPLNAFNESRGLIDASVKSIELKQR